MRRPGTALLAVLSVLTLSRAPSAEAASSRVYLILPFEDAAPETSRDWLREAMALSLGDYFLGAGQKVVDREDRVLAMEELRLPAGAPLTLATSIRFGRSLRSHRDGLRPDRLVVGKFSLDQGRVSLSARIMDLGSNRAGAWKHEEGNLRDLLRLQRGLAHSLLRGDGIPANNLGTSSDNAQAGDSFPLVAYENYVRGLIEPDPSRQLALLRKALEQSPGYPKACYHLSRLLVRSGRSKEAEAALKGISGDPLPYAAEYHALLGSLSLDAGRLSEAETEAQKSLSLRETSEARVLMARLARARGEPDAAREELQKAESLDPDNPDIEPLRRQLDRNSSPRR